MIINEYTNFLKVSGHTFGWVVRHVSRDKTIKQKGEKNFDNFKIFDCGLTKVLFRSLYWFIITEINCMFSTIRM